MPMNSFDTISKQSNNNVWSLKNARLTSLTSLQGLLTRGRVKLILCHNSGAFEDAMLALKGLAVAKQIENLISISDLQFEVYLMIFTVLESVKDLRYTSIQIAEKDQRLMKTDKRRKRELCTLETQLRYFLMETDF